MPRGRNGVMGEQLAQVDNRDPFAVPVWRSPVYRTPEPVIMVVQLVRLIWRVLWFALTHPAVDAVAALVVVDLAGPELARRRRPGRGGRCIGLAGLRVMQPEWFARFVAVPVRDWWRWWFYRRRWKAAMTLAGLAPDYRGQPMLPVLDRVHRAGAVDLVRVGLVTGQAPADFDGPGGEPGARVRRAAVPGPRPSRPACWCWSWSAPTPSPTRSRALPITGEVDLAGLPVGRCEDGSPWRLRLASTHVLIAGATGSGKGSVIWSLIRALLPAIAAGWVQVWALDPKRMELSFGRALFHRYACQATAMVELLEAAVAEMHDRAEQFGGRTRTFTPSTGFPFLVVLVDELAFLTAYQPERDLRKRAEAAIATLTSQGRSVGVCVVGALQDPRKDVISLRNLFSTRIALRLDESDQVDMVLGDGARDRGALADQISPLPWTGAGVGYVRLEASPDPVRVRAAYVTDDDICAMAAAVGYLPGGGL